jgi:hypothetical protein
MTESSHGDRHEYRAPSFADIVAVEKAAAEIPEFPELGIVMWSRFLLELSAGGWELVEQLAQRFDICAKEAAERERERMRELVDAVKTVMPLLNEDGERHPKLEAILDSLREEA